jgi:Acyl-CoA dehydrogenase, C-terminal domain
VHLVRCPPSATGGYGIFQHPDHGRDHVCPNFAATSPAPKTAVDIIHQCLLTHGHYGWSLDLPHQQRLRDVMGLEIGDGTAQIMKLIIARERTRQGNGRPPASTQKPST